MRYPAARLAISVLAVVGVAVAPAAGDEHAAPATVRLEVDGSYIADSSYGEHGVVRGWFPIRRVFLPFKPLARSFLGHAGARLVRGDDAEAVLHIEVLGGAHGMLYDFMEHWQRVRQLRFIGADIQGRVVLETAAGLVCGARFAGEIRARTGIPIIIGRDYREAAGLAPFDQALAEPGSFVAALAAVIGAIYGPEALAAARADPDPAVARFARSAYDHLAGHAPLGPTAPRVECSGGEALDRRKAIP